MHYFYKRNQEDEEEELNKKRDQQIKNCMNIALVVLPFIFISDYMFHFKTHKAGSAWQRISYPFILWISALLAKLLTKYSGYESYGAYIFSITAMISSVER